MLKIVVSLNRAEPEPVQVLLTDSTTGYRQTVTGTITNIRDTVYQTLKQWQAEDRGHLKYVSIDYYARYVEHEAILANLEAGWQQAQ